MLEQADELKEWQERRRRGTENPFDAPDGAQAYFLMKRLPEGQTTYDSTKLIEAAAATGSMPVYSTATGSYAGAPPRSGIRRHLVNGQNIPGTWTPLGPGNVGGRTRALLIHPTTPNTMWAGAVGGGIWKSTDGGASWSPKADLAVNIAVNSMILDPRNPLHLYAGTGEGFFNGDAIRGAGILESVDGGETWSQLASTNNSNFYYVQKIIMSKGSSQRIYAATRTGVFRTVDGGLNWTKVLDGTGVNGCMDLAIQTDRPLAMVFAACGTFGTNNSTTGAIYRALDTGSTMTWSSVHAPTNMGRTSLALAPSNQNIIYALTSSNQAGNFNQGLLAVYRSVTSGSAGSWTTQVSNTSTTQQNTLLLSNPVYGVLTACGFGTSQAINQGWYDNTIAVDPVNPNVVWAGGTDLFRSDDAGQNWGTASYWWFTPGVDPDYAHADNHTIVFHPQYDGSANQTLFIGNDGGIFKSTNARATVGYSPAPIGPSSPICGNTDFANDVHWTPLNNGYEVSQYYDGAVFPDNASFFGGLQDNGTQLGTVSGGRNAWSAIRGGDGGYVAVNPNDTTMLWAENTGFSIVRSTNGGATWSSFISGEGESSGNFLFINPFTQDPNNPANMWSGGAFIYRTTQATAKPTSGNIWVRASAFLSQRQTAIAVAPGDSNVVYAGGQTGSVWRNTAALSATSATTWSSTKPRPDTNYISWVAVDPVVKTTVYVTVSTFNSGAGTGHVFKSTDGAVTWTNIDGTGATSIPDVPAHSIVIDPNNTNRLYVATDIGLFMTLDGGVTWNRENTGFAHVIVEALRIRGNYLYAFTHGRSVWRVSLVAGP